MPPMNCRRVSIGDGVGLRGYFAGPRGPGSVGGRARMRPPMISTGLDSIFMAAGVSPARVAVAVIAPGVSIERMATRLMPHSVLR